MVLTPQVTYVVTGLQVLDYSFPYLIDGDRLTGSLLPKVKGVPKGKSLRLSLEWWLSYVLPTICLPAVGVFTSPCPLCGVTKTVSDTEGSDSKSKERKIGRPIKSSCKPQGQVM